MYTTDKSEFRLRLGSGLTVTTIGWSIDDAENSTERKHSGKKHRLDLSTFHLSKEDKPITTQLLDVDSKQQSATLPSGFTGARERAVAFIVDKLKVPSSVFRYKTYPPIELNEANRMRVPNRVRRR
jgi:hypothetical protein